MCRVRLLVELRAVRSQAVAAKASEPRNASELRLDSRANHLHVELVGEGWRFAAEKTRRQASSSQAKGLIHFKVVFTCRVLEIMNKGLYVLDSHSSWFSQSQIWLQHG